MSRRVVGWTLLGLLAFGAALLVRLPASWLGSMLPAGVSCGAFGGTIWQGSCAAAAVVLSPSRTLVFDRVDWQLEPLALLRARLAAQVTLQQRGGEASGRLLLSASGDFDAADVTGRIPVDGQLLPMLPADWRGELAADGLHFARSGGAISRLQGAASLLDLRDAAGNALGSYSLRFAEASGPPPFSGELRDEGGPLGVQAAARVEASGAWQLDGRVTPRAQAAPGLVRQLSMLGPSAPDGSYPFSIAGETG